ncbi:DUF5067 domain-containing protein [Lactococcus kimchii]|uniref:DUF5067 domain-containing protein n=1 Tax=Lactococcus sp. S-13 TaxID=2507158 RepID=UPI0016811373|nr:DUF5067 domain-containing protein [Lactococcus sp. S-13]
MKKFLLVGTTLLSLSLLVACGNTSSKNTVKSSSYKTSAVEKTKNYTLHNTDFKVPASWKEKDGKDGSAVKYFYPKEGMMLTRFAKTDETIMDQSSREAYISGLKSTPDFKNFKATGENKSSDNNYAWNISFTMDEKDYQGELVVADVAEGLLSFMIATPNNTYKNYQSDFAKICQSINFLSRDTNYDDSGTDSLSSDSGWDDSTHTFTSDDGILKIDKTEITNDYNGKPAFCVYFTLTNKGDDTAVSQILFQQLARVQQLSTNTSNDLDFAMMSLDAPENHLQDNINPNGTISGYYPFELENTSDPVAIQLQRDFQTVDTYKVPLQ